MGDGKPKQQRENLEQSSFKAETNIETVKRLASKVLEKDKNREHTMALADLDVLHEKATEKNMKAFTYMQYMLIQILTKLAKNNPDKNLKNISPLDLSKEARKASETNGIKWEASEVTAIAKLDELNLDLNNPTTKSLHAAWGSWVEKAEEARDGFKKKTIDWIKKNRGLAIAAGIGGAIGVYFGIKLLKWVFGEVKDAAKEQVKSFFSPGKWIGLGVIAAGAYWGKDIIKKIYEKLGVPEGLDKIKGQATELKAAVEDLSKKIEKLSTITNPEERAKLEQEILEGKKKIDELSAKGGIKPTEIVEKSKTALEELRWKSVRPEVVPQQERERAIRLSKSIKNLNTSFDIAPQLIAAIGNMKYEEAIITGGGNAAKAAHLLQLAYNGEISMEKAKKIVYTRSPEQMMNLLKQILNNNGNIEEFKNRSVYEVLEMIEKNPKKYINGTELKKLQLEKIKKDKRDEMTSRLIKNPELWNDPKFQHEYAALQAETGGTAVLSLSKRASLWIYENGVPVIKQELRFFHGTLTKLGENLIKNDDVASKTFGYYLLSGGALTASCGATLGTVMGVGKAFATGRPFVTYGVWQIGIETVKYGWRGLKLPLNALLWPLKALYYSKEIGVSPLKMIKGFFYNEIFAPIESVKYKTFIKQRGVTSTLIEKLLEGKLKMNSPRQLDNMVWKLQNRLENLKREYEGMMKIEKPSYSKRTQIQNLKKDIDIYEEFFKEFTEKKELKRNLLRLKKTESFVMEWSQTKYENWVKTNLGHLSEAQKNILIKNPKIGCMVFGNKELIKDPVILKALEGGDMKEIETTILKRFKEIGKMSESEIAEAARAAVKADAEAKAASESIIQITEVKKPPLKELGEVNQELKAVEEQLGKVKSEIEAAEKMKTGEGKTNLEFLKKQEVRLNRMKSALEDLQKSFIEAANKGMIGQETDAIKTAREAVYKSYDLTLKEIKIGQIVDKTGETASKSVAIALEAAEADAKAFAKGTSTAEKTAAKLAEEAAEALKTVQKAQQLAKSAQAGSAAVKNLDNALNVANEAVEKAAEAAAITGKTSKLVYLSKALKGLGILGSGAGAVLSFYGAGKGFYEAATTKVEGRAGYEALHSALLTANGTADAALFATMLGAKGTAVKVASRAWLPLLPIVWAGTKTYESWKDGNLTEYEWAQKYSYDDLVHQWFTTVRSRSEGDAIKTGFKALFSSESTYQKIDKDIELKKEIAHKIFRVLIAYQTNPEILRVLSTEKQSDERDKKIENLINGTYTKYHEYYFQQEGANLITNYETAKTFITNACIYNEAMQIREQKKTEGVNELKIGPLNLMEERFEITGDNKNPKAKRAYMPSDIVKHYKGEMLSAVKEKNPAMRSNLDKMETSYLLLLYVQIMKKQGEAKEDADKNTLNEYSKLFRVYLKSARNINVDTAIQNPIYFKHEMTLEQLKKNLEDLSATESPSYKQFEQGNIERKPGVYAVYKLAQYFSYTGGQKESELKTFFNEDKASFHGIYWKGGNWYAQKEGWDFDTKIGPSLDYKTVEKMVSEMYQNADNILEHRKSGTFVTSYDFSDQVRKMAGILQSSYNEGVEKYEPKSPKLSHIASSPLEKKEVGKAENFKDEYEKEVTRIKQATSWSQMQCEVKDRETIVLSRSDSGEKTTLKKAGERWNVGDYAFDVTFTQAVAMGNMLNYIKKIIKEGNWKGGSSRPFEVDGNNIDFDKAGTPFDTRVIDGNRQGNWLNFMSGIGISKEMLIETLNNWFQKEIS